MGGRYDIGADAVGEAEEEAVAGLARELLNFGFRFDAVPDQDLVRQPKPRRPGGDLFGLCTRAFAQAMIDGRDMETRARIEWRRLSRPLGGEQHQSDRIRAP